MGSESNIHIIVPPCVRNLEGILVSLHCSHHTPLPAVISAGEGEGVNSNVFVSVRD